MAPQAEGRRRSEVLEMQTSHTHTHSLSLSLFAPPSHCILHTHTMLALSAESKVSWRMHMPQ